MTAAAVARTLRRLEAGGTSYAYVSLAAAESEGLGRPSAMPVSLKVLFENLLRHHHLGHAVSDEEVGALGHWPEHRKGGQDIAFHAGRIITPDSSGIPLLADLAAMRDAMVELGGDPRRINPLSPVDLVIDHSVIVDVHGQSDAVARNMEIEYQRNGERYEFVRWAQTAFGNLRVVPSGQGIIHQIHLEHLAQVVLLDDADPPFASPDTVLGMDSHTPMVNALGVLGWGCGGIEAGAAMLGQPMSMRAPEVVGVRLVGTLRDGASATDLALTITERLRKVGVVQKFVEYFGPGVPSLRMETRATIANMAPEYGATVGFFPIDNETIAYLRQTGRTEQHIRLVEAYARTQGLWRNDDAPIAFSDEVEIDLGGVESCIAGPRRPQDRVPLAQASRSAASALARPAEAAGDQSPVTAPDGLRDGHIALAAITSCTNTSNPQAIIGAALLARDAVRRGLRAKPWVKTSFSPGSRVVADYLARSELQPALDALGFQIVGYGCMTCMGNSGPLLPDVAAAVERDDLRLAAVLSGNRNFEGRIHPQCRINYLASPALVVAYAIAGSMLVDLTRDPLGHDADGRPVRLDEIWPNDADIDAVIRSAITPDLYRSRYADVYAGDEHWRRLPVCGGDTYAWKPGSTYILRPPFFEGIAVVPQPIADIRNARALAVLGDSVTTDHISPIGAINASSVAGQHLVAAGTAPRDFNSYGSRRVNHEVMMRGTFASPRLRNEMAGDRSGGFTRHMPDGELMSMFEAAELYRREGVPLVVVAGADYGTGSSRDWAAKGAQLLGVRAIIAESFERIHRSNLVAMGVIPFEFPPGESRTTLRLDGSETYDFRALADLASRSSVACRIRRADGSATTIDLLCRVDTAHELDYLRHGGILQFMLRRALLTNSPRRPSPSTAEPDAAP